MEELESDIQAIATEAIFQDYDRDPNNWTIVSNGDGVKRVFLDSKDDLAQEIIVFCDRKKYRVTVLVEQVK